MHLNIAKQALAYNEVVEKYLASLDVKPISKDGYRKRLRGFFNWVTSNQKEFSPESIYAYKAYLSSNSYSALTACAYLVPVKGFFRWTARENIHPDISFSVRPPRRPKGFRKDPLTAIQAVRLLASVDRRTLKGKRDYALLNLMLRTGPRTIELVRADVGDIRQESGETVLWLQGKGSEEKDAFVVLTDESLQAMHEYLFARGAASSDEPLFASTSDNSHGRRISTRSIRRIVKERLRNVKIDSLRISAHSFRHSAVTFALLGGASIQEVQQLARHSSINTTMIYAHNIKRAAGVPERKIDAFLQAASTTTRTMSDIPR